MDYRQGFQKIKRPYIPQQNSSQNEQNSQVPHSPKPSKRNVIWFNPPFNVFCSSNVGQKFRDLIEIHFNNNSFLGKLFNKNKLTVDVPEVPDVPEVRNPEILGSVDVPEASNPEILVLNTQGGQLHSQRGSPEGLQWGMTRSGRAWRSQTEPD